MGRFAQGPLERPAAGFCGRGPLLLNAGPSGRLAVPASSRSLTALLKDLQLRTARLRLLGDRAEGQADQTARRTTTFAFLISTILPSILHFSPCLLTAVEVNSHQRHRGQL